MRRSLLLFPAVLMVASAAYALITSASLRELSQGATFDVAGAGFAKPVRAWLDMDGRRIPLRIARGATDTAFTATLATFPRGTNGDCLLAVKAKGTKVPSYFGGMSIELPAVADVQPSAAAGGAEVTVTGTFFGSKKPRVHVGGVRAKVTLWSDTEIRFLVPSRMAPGAYFLDIESRAGLAPTHPTFTVSGG